MLLETGADHNFISTRFSHSYKISLFNSEIKSIKLANGCRVLVQHAAAPFQIKLGVISLTVTGPFIEYLINHLVAGLD